MTVGCAGRGSHRALLLCLSLSGKGNQCGVCRGTSVTVTSAWSISQHKAIANPLVLRMQNSFYESDLTHHPSKT